MLRNKERTNVQKTERKTPAKATKSQNALLRYFQETGEELRKVAWPTREQTTRLTVIVLVSTAAAAIFLGGLDEGFRLLSSLLVNVAP